MSDGSVKLINSKLHGVMNDLKESTMNRAIEKISLIDENLHGWKGNTTLEDYSLINESDFHDFLVSPVHKSENKEESSSITQSFNSATERLPIYDTGRLVFWTSHGRLLSWTTTFDKICIQVGNEVLELSYTISGPLPLRNTSMNKSSNVQKKEVDTNPVTEDSTENPESVSDNATRKAEENNKNNASSVDYPKLLMDYVVISRYYEIMQASDSQKLNLMLIQPNQREPGIWSRVGLAEINESDWLKVGRDWKMIILE
jgi:hypothetical protein